MRNTIKSNKYVLLSDSILNEAIQFPYFLDTRHGKPGRLYYQMPPAAPPQKNAANISPHRGYFRESFCGGVFITHSYRKIYTIKIQALSPNMTVTALPKHKQPRGKTQTNRIRHSTHVHGVYNKWTDPN